MGHQHTVAAGLENNGEAKPWNIRAGCLGSRSCAGPSRTYSDLCAGFGAEAKGETLRYGASGSSRLANIVLR